MLMYIAHPQDYLQCAEYRLPNLNTRMFWAGGANCQSTVMDHSDCLWGRSKSSGQHQEVRTLIDSVRAKNSFTFDHTYPGERGMDTLWVQGLNWGDPAWSRSPTSDLRSPPLVWDALPFGRFYYKGRYCWCFCSFLMLCHGYVVPWVHCIGLLERMTEM